MRSIISGLVLAELPMIPGAGAIILNVRGKTYAVNGMAGSRHVPIQARTSMSAPSPHAD
jgi:hypothetical protein